MTLRCLPPDEDNIIPVYGFGDDRTGDHSIFTFAQRTADPLAGFPLEGIRARYREVVHEVTMAGPTSFAPIINQAVNIVNASGGEYHILVIIADGQVTRSVDVPQHAVSKNEKETIDAITYASQFPLSIVMVGVGDGPWEAMEYFDNYLLHRRFDNFQFVDYHVRSLSGVERPKRTRASPVDSLVCLAQKIMARFPTPQLREAQFALQALMEIPDQYRIIKEMGFLTRRPPFQYRHDLPRVEVFPPPVTQPPTTFPPAYPLIGAPSAPAYAPPTATEGTSVASQVYYSEQQQQQAATPAFASGAVQLDRRTSSAEIELRRMQEELLCPICEDRRKDLVFQCGHETCAKCGEQLQDCPICRQRIQVRIKRYA
jgi:E3 ubiquitin-protein ligase RGLG